MLRKLFSFQAEIRTWGLTNFELAFLTTTFYYSVLLRKYIFLSVSACICTVSRDLEIFLYLSIILQGTDASLHTVKENAEALLVATKEIGLEVNADKTKYMVMSRDRNAGRGHSVKTDNSSIERVEEFIYLGTTLTYQNSIQEEIKS